MSAIKGKIEAATGLSEELPLRGLRQYFNDDWSPRSDIHPLMSEVARLAVHRRITQEELAKLYNDNAGTSAVGGGNISRHFRLGAPRPKVVKAYQKIFGLSNAHVGILLALGAGTRYFEVEAHPTAALRKYPTLRTLINEELEPPEIERIFQDDAIDEACQILFADEPLALECLDEAELWASRCKAFNLQVKDLLNVLLQLDAEIAGSGWWSFDHDLGPWIGSRISNDLLVKWIVVARNLQKKRGFVLMERWASKTVRRLMDEHVLLDVWNGVHRHVGWYEWVAIRSMVEAALYRRNLPIDKMYHVLLSDRWYDEWADVHDPERGDFLAQQYADLERIGQAEET